MFTFLADVGCRHAQAYKVRWRDVVEIEPGVWGVRFWRAGEQKGGRTRTVPVTSRVAAMLARRRSLKGDGPFSGLKRQRATKLWNKAKALTHLADEPECVPHALRHTCATRLLEKTGDLKLVQEWLGHTKIETTGNIYAKVMSSRKVQALGLLEEGWNGMSPIAHSGQIQDRNPTQSRDVSTTRH